MHSSPTQFSRRNYPGKPFVEFTVIEAKDAKPKQPVSTRRKTRAKDSKDTTDAKPKQPVSTGRKTRAKDRGPLGKCSTREQWMKIIKEKGELIVPGSWWPGSSPEIKK